MAPCEPFLLHPGRAEDVGHTGLRKSQPQVSPELSSYVDASCSNKETAREGRALLRAAWVGHDSTSGLGEHHVEVYKCKTAHN